ncbi:F-box protein CPR1-like [Solanum dulcamara]|uniref:F-box protein CPR1-like n=1 Tax=Solanum dulcamara TaxID=45834 RepID=UPI002485201E|nr:F-box protein CPR1-like [Solanum dulcamara]
MSEYLPTEMMVQIFSRLPPKSLLQLRCLSKFWNSLISSPDFIWLHTQQSVLLKPYKHLFKRNFSTALKKEKIRLADVSDVGTEMPLRSPFNGRAPDYIYCRIIGICNGVLCVLDDLFEYKSRVVLWNPSINRCLTLPMTPLCCDNSRTYVFVFGFGFAAKTRDYKVVRMAYARGDGQYLLPPRVEIYALSSGIWKDFDGFIPDIGVVEYFWTQVVVCGKVHWTAYKRNGERRVENLIMAFNLNEEIFQELSLPEILVNEPPMNLNVAQLEELLVVYQYDTRIWSSSCSIWVMKRYGDTDSWSKEYNVALGQGHLGMVLAVTDCSKILLTDITGLLAVYNPETQTKESIDLAGTMYSFYYDNYEESLVLLDKGELLPPVDLTSEESTDADDEDVEENDPQIRELRKHHVMHRRVTAFLGARNNNEQML